MLTMKNTNFATWHGDIKKKSNLVASLSLKFLLCIILYIAVGKFLEKLDKMLILRVEIVTLKSFFSLFELSYTGWVF